jgi:hypothetical protein
MLECPLHCLALTRITAPLLPVQYHIHPGARSTATNQAATIPEVLRTFWFASLDTERYCSHVHWKIVV